MITLPQLNAALARIHRELDRHGFLTEQVLGTDVFLVPVSLRAYGWQYYRGTGHIHVPAVVVTDMLDKLFGRPSAYSLPAVLGHEYGHAVAHHHRGLIRSKRFREVFWAAHDSCDRRPWDYDRELFVSRYAASHPSEDFAETFMLFLLHHGRIPHRHDHPAIRAKWGFIELLGTALAAGKRQW